MPPTSAELTSASGRISLLRDVYRSLLRTGRTYAAFNTGDARLVTNFSASHGPVLDPMSGYGRTTAFCARYGLPSTSIEFNPPQYLWQTLVLPELMSMNCDVAATILSKPRRWPRPRTRAVVSSELFPKALQSILFDLFDIAVDAFANYSTDISTSLLAAALLMPFAGRLACTSPSDVSTHSKQGGTCVLLNWQDDFRSYLRLLITRLQHDITELKCTQHTLKLADARTVDLSGEKFGSMLTSPPYPNHRDFSSIFLPENVFSRLLFESRAVPLHFERTHIIGTNFIREQKSNVVRTHAALTFLEQVDQHKRSSRARYDDDVYYIPYLIQYFSDLERAYTNIARFTARRFLGFIIVVDNTHRGRVIPVAASVMEIWKTLGFNVAEHSAREVFHVGAKNPRARGIRAKHREVVIKVWR